MKKNFTTLIVSTFIILTCFAYQSVYSMQVEEDDDILHDCLCPIKLELMREPVITADGYTYEREAIEAYFKINPGNIRSPLTGLPLEDISLRSNIALKNVIQALYSKELLNMPAEREIMEDLKEGVNELEKDFFLVPLDEPTSWFQNGILSYRPILNSDEGKIDLQVSPDGTFNLSECGDTGKYLSISTGYKTKKNEQNAKKLEIWIVPRFLVEKEIEGTASHFKEIYPNEWREEVPFSIMLTWGGWANVDWYDYLTSDNWTLLQSVSWYAGMSTGPVDFLSKWNKSTTSKEGHSTKPFLNPKPNGSYFAYPEACSHFQINFPNLK